MSWKRLSTLAVLPVMALGQLLSAAPAQAVDVYTTVGTHEVNGRQWRTECEKYDANIWRCRTEIWATQIQKVDGAYRQATGWTFNNLTYLAAPKKAWGTNPLANTGEWTTAEGRKWRTECGTPATGTNACRSYILATFIAYENGTYVQKSGWLFNNIVIFGSTFSRPTMPYTERRLLGTSVEGRPIYAYQVGDPSATEVKMVLGQMHGEEPAGRRTAEAMVSDSREVKGIQLWVVPTINPDGAAKGTRGNAHGVDLNGNWPVEWVPVPKGRYYSGTGPLSEPESRAFTEFLKEIQPSQLVSIHQPLYAVDGDSVKDQALHDALVREMMLPSKALLCRSTCHGTMTMWYNANYPGAAITIEYGYTPTDKYVTVTARDALVRVLGGSY